MRTNLATTKEQTVAKTQGGAHRSKAIASLNPISAASVGKKKLKLKETAMDVSVSDSHQTLQSPRTLIRVCARLSDSLSSMSLTPESSSSLIAANRRSEGVSQVEVSGKLGRVKTATIAQKMESDPVI